MSFDPGSLRERVRLERPIAQPDDYGNTVTGFRQAFERAALFIMKPGSEAVTAARLQGQQPVTMVLRFDSCTAQIAPDWRVIDARTGTVYAVKAAADMDRRRQWMTLTCVSGEAA